MANYLIIGASSGIGKTLANQLSGAGHKVYGTYHKNVGHPENASLEYHSLNVLDESVVLDFLPDSIQGLVYCPGSINLRPFERIKPADFTQDFNLHVLGAIKVIQQALPRLKKEKNSAILLFSTVAVQTGMSFHSQVATSKGALEGLTRSLAAELSPAIRVNCIAPSLTDTPLAAPLLNNNQKREANANRHPLKKIGTPEDIANLAEFLISDKSGWITGQIIHADGGMSSVRV